jgi:nitric oxide reductase NorE protein
MNPRSATQASPIPADTGMWIFILADMCIFALYFWVFAWDKAQHAEQFIQGQATLNTTLGGTNMFILLVSSFFMAKAVHAARQMNVARYGSYIRLTILCGCIFLVIKTMEYSEKLNAGFHVASNEFYRNYFAFTGLHALHVITGLCLLIYAMPFGTKQQPISQHARYIENSGLYWHMVDLLWVVLFALIYLAP